MTTEQKAKHAAAMRRWRQKNPEKARANDRVQAQRKRERDPERFRAKAAERARRYRARHPEKVKENNATERAKASKRRWQAQHPDACRLYYERNRDEQREKRARYYQENRDKFRVANRNLKARRRGAEGKHTAAQVVARFAFHGNRCVYCGVTGQLEADHMIPLARGGTNWPANLVPACGTCNNRKHAKTYFEFMAARAA